MKELKVICNKFIPFPGYYAMMLFGKIFVRQEYCGREISQRTINHEGIHLCQALDFVNNIEKLQILGFIIFYIIYFIEWLIKLIISLFTLGRVKAYRSISFEQEAYSNEEDYTYQDMRKPFSWIKYIFKLIV